MSPIEKFHSYVLVLTIAIMFAGINLATAAVNATKAQSYVIGIAVAALGSAGIYVILSRAIRWLLSKWEWLLKQTLGPFYVKGIWGGLVLTRSGRPVYIVEQMEQTLSKVTVRGTSYTPDRHPEGNWTTESVQIDPTRGEMFVFYSNNVPWKNNRVEALGRLQFFRPDERSGPFKMEGYAIDSDSIHKLRYVDLRKLDLCAASEESKEIDNAALEATVSLFKGQLEALVAQQQELLQESTEDANEDAI